MLNRRMMFASALAGSIAGLGLFTSQRNDPKHWTPETAFGMTRFRMTGTDEATINAAKAKRDRKAAKRLRDAQRARGGGDA